VKFTIALSTLLVSLAAVAQPGPSRVPVEDVRILMVAAIDSPTGEAHGLLTGQMAKMVTEKFRASGPILIDITTERRYRQAGCSRLKLTLSQQGVNLPGASAPSARTIDIGINYCRDGSPPKSLA
jgi:hypothetical protein